MCARFLGPLAATSVGITASLVVPVLAQGTRLTEPAGGFSYTVPAGWKVRAVPGQKYKMCYGPSANNFVPLMIELIQQDPQTTEKFTPDGIADANKHMKRFHVVSQSPIVTASGLHGIRLAFIGTPATRSLYQVFYVFPKYSTEKIAVLFTCLEADGPKYAPAADSAMKTFKL